MKTKIQTNYDFDFCMDQPDGNRLVGFQIDLRWKVPALDDRWRSGNLVEAMDWMAVDELSVGTVIRYGDHGRRVRFGTGRRARVFEIRGVSSGGNWYWDHVRVPVHEQPHLMNHLRRQRAFDVTGFGEWDHEFVREVWQSRSSLTCGKLRDFAGDFVSDWLHRTAGEHGTTVEELLREKTQAA